MRTKMDGLASGYGGVWGARALAIAMFAGFCGLGAEAAAASHAARAPSLERSVAATYASLGVAAAPAPSVPPPEKLVWRGVDVDGDGQDDFTNPTGRDVRGCDDDEGRLWATREGRRHPVERLHDRQVLRQVGVARKRGLHAGKR